MKKYKVRGIGKVKEQDFIIMKLNLILDRIRELEKKEVHQRNLLEEVLQTIEEIKNEKD